jgi:hypothetical protein
MKQTLVLGFSRHIAAVLVLMVATQMSGAAVVAAQEPQQPAPVVQHAAQQAQTSIAQTLPAQTAADQTGKPGADMPEAPDPAAQQNQPPGPAFAMRSQDSSSQDAQQPVGTAAAPYTRPTGVAGSRPSGAAIAPAKQKRRKAMLIRVGLIVGGAVAVGSVVGLSKGSSSRP